MRCILIREGLLKEAVDLGTKSAVDSQDLPDRAPLIQHACRRSTKTPPVPTHCTKVRGCLLKQLAQGWAKSRLYPRLQPAGQRCNDWPKWSTNDLFHLCETGVNSAEPEAPSSDSCNACQLQTIMQHQLFAKARRQNIALRNARSASKRIGIATRPGSPARVPEKPEDVSALGSARVSITVSVT